MKTVNARVIRRSTTFRSTFADSLNCIMSQQGLKKEEMSEPREPLDAQVADDLIRAASAISNALVSVFEGINQIRDRVIEVRRDVVERRKLFTPQHLAGLRPLILEQLKRRPFLDGLGILAASDLFADRTRYLEWWRQDINDVIPLWLNFDPTSVDIYDYLEMEWFTRAQRDNAKTVFGPYVDYTGADHYVLTMTVPVVDEVFIGVVGADLRMSLFEAEILPVLYDLDWEVVLVNSERRVVSTNSQRWTVGSRLATIPEVSEGGFVAIAEIGTDSDWVLAAVKLVE